MLYFRKKGIGPVVAVSLLLIVTLSSVIFFGDWFSSFISTLQTNIEVDSNKALKGTTIRVDAVINGELFLYNSYSSNQTINSVRIGSNDCITTNTMLQTGMNRLNISSCIESLNTGSSQEILIISDSGIYSSYKTISFGY